MFGSELSLQFRLFGIPVQVSLFFLILAVVINQGARSSPLLLAAWVVIVLASVLAHELGHALSAQAFGQQPYITLWGLGGLTTWRQTTELSAGRRFVISAAGPVVGLVIGFVALFPWVLMRESPGAGATILSYIVFANLGWGILNLVPMLPLDGGNIMAAVFDAIAPGRGRRAARYGSIVTALVIAPLALFAGMFLMVFYCALSIWMNIQELRRPPAPPTPPGEAVIDIPAERLSNDVTPPRDDRLP